jgi:hypothetical protein
MKQVKTLSVAQKEPQIAGRQPIFGRPDFGHTAAEDFIALQEGPRPYGVDRAQKPLLKFENGAITYVNTAPDLGKPPSLRPLIAKNAAAIDSRRAYTVQTHSS